MDMGEDDALAFQVITHWLYTKTCELSEKDPDDADYTSRLATFKDWVCLFGALSSTLL